jgi:hypothetical protein
MCSSHPQDPPDWTWVDHGDGYLEGHYQHPLDTEKRWLWIARVSAVEDAGYLLDTWALVGRGVTYDDWECANTLIGRSESAHRSIEEAKAAADKKWAGWPDHLFPVAPGEPTAPTR